MKMKYVFSDDPDWLIRVYMNPLEHWKKAHWIWRWNAGLVYFQRFNDPHRHPASWWRN